MPYGVFHPGSKKPRPKPAEKNLGNTYMGQKVIKASLPLKGGAKPKR